MISRRFVPLFLATALVASAKTPVSYELLKTIRTLPVGAASPSFGTEFFFTKGDQTLYRIVSAGTPIESPAPAYQFWSPKGAAIVLPPATYDAIEPRAMNNDGTVVGKVIDTTEDAYREAAFTWNYGDETTIPNFFDPLSSSFSALAASGFAGGLNSTGGINPVRVTWNTAGPTLPPTTVPLPNGFTGGQVQGVSDGGAAVLFVDDGSNHFRAAVWDGSSTRLLGSALAANEVLHPANLAMNARGDIAVLVFVPDGSYRLKLYPAWTNYTARYNFVFAGPAESVYNLHLSDNGIASFDTASEDIHVVSMATGDTRTFKGYASFLNASGQLVFGTGGKLNFWDAAAWTGSPTIVPLDLPAGASAPVIVGFNDDAHLLALHPNAAGTQTSLSVLKPIYPGDIIPEDAVEFVGRKQFHFVQGDPIRRRIVRAKVDPTLTVESVTYTVKNSIPEGTRFRKHTGILTGHPTKPGVKNVRIVGTFILNGQTYQTKAQKVRIRIKPLPAR